MWRKSRRFICFCASSRCFVFYNIRYKSPKFCFTATVIPAGKGALCQKMIKPVLDYSINSSALSCCINGSMFLDPDSTTIFANEIRPLNFSTHRWWLLQIGADWKLSILDQAIGHPTHGALVSLSICVSDHGSGLGAPESLSCFPNCWDMNYLADLFSLVKPPIALQDILFFWHVLLYWKCWLLRIKTAGDFLNKKL